MTRSSTPRDPRNILTPDTFEVSEELLCVPLAAPRRRLFALLIDLMVVGLITLVTNDFGMVLGIVAAVFFIRTGFKRTPVKGSVFGRAMRISVGGLGLFIGLVTVSLWALFGFNVDFGSGGSDEDPAALLSASWGDEADRAFEVLINAREEFATTESARSASEGELADLHRQLASAQAQLENQAGGGIFGTLRGFVDELFFGFGWWTLYLTVFLSWWKGQTVGKRLLGIRVVRLDGEPITWWVAFERVGGFAAGFATGLLGFAQVFWDANRQGIHDRIVGTVVIVDGAEKVADWESAL